MTFVYSRIYWVWPTKRWCCVSVLPAAAQWSVILGLYFARGSCRVAAELHKRHLSKDITVNRNCTVWLLSLLKMKQTSLSRENRSGTLEHPSEPDSDQMCSGFIVLVHLLFISMKTKQLVTAVFKPLSQLHVKLSIKEFPCSSDSPYFLSVCADALLTHLFAWMTVFSSSEYDIKPELWLTLKQTQRMSSSHSSLFLQLEMSPKLNGEKWSKCCLKLKYYDKTAEHFSGNCWSCRVTRPLKSDNS